MTAMDSEGTKIRISQAYLELARSYIGAIATIKKSFTSDSPQVELDNQATMTFAFSALSTIFSYLAIEAYVNYDLFGIWQHSRNAHDVIAEVKRTSPQLQIRPVYNDFYQKYGHVDDFIKLKETKLGELKERIKAVCKANGIPQIYDSDPKLWNDFLALLEDTRHALVHPNPHDEAFSKIVPRVFSTEPYASYPTIASKVISHFFHSTNVKPPDYLSANQLFQITNIDILF